MWTGAPGLPRESYFYNADGQLARLTHRESRQGRIIDSIADHLVLSAFTCIEPPVPVRRLITSDLSSALAAGVSHALEELLRMIIAIPILRFATSTDGLAFLYLNRDRIIGN